MLAAVWNLNLSRGLSAHTVRYGNCALPLGKRQYGKQLARPQPARPWPAAETALIEAAGAGPGPGLRA